MLGRAALAATLLAGCFHPEPQPGAACAAGFACPDGLVCSLATQTCELTAMAPDAHAPDAMRFDAGLDADPDGPAVQPDAPDAACASFSALYDTCTLEPGPAVSITSSTTIDTSAMTGPFANQQIVTLDGHEVVVASVASLNLASGTTVTVVGTRALAIVAFGAVTIAGTLTTTAGGRTACDLQALPGEPESGGAAGGGGGGFQGSGGKGGDGNAPFAGSVGGAGGGTESLPTTLYGGCAGAKGGRGANPASPPADGGGAGGGIAIIARSTLMISGVVTAPGSGGRHPTGPDDGGGGGGSGGLIYLEAGTLVATGTLAANGGGGGGANGSQNPLSTTGENGLPSSTRAAGGNGSPGGSAGGSGSGGTALTGNPVSVEVDGGGGGGGGGAGWIILRAHEDPATVLGVVSPPALTL